MQRNWELGGYSVSSMERRSNYENRRINVSQKETQGDVLAGAGLIISGVPTSLAEMRMLKPSQRRVQIGHQTTARLHTAQLDEYHNEEAAEHVRFAFPQFDEGTDKATIALIFEVMWARGCDSCLTALRERRRGSSRWSGGSRITLYGIVTCVYYPFLVFFYYGFLVLFIL